VSYRQPITCKNKAINTPFFICVFIVLLYNNHHTQGVTITHTNGMTTPSIVDIKKESIMPLILSPTTSNEVLNALKSVLSRASTEDQQEHAALLAQVEKEDQQTRDLNHFVQLAKLHQEDGVLEIDNEANVSISETDEQGRVTGVYVQAWFYVSDDD
jgi:hypothetical protein